jgi:hypothetical protein
MSSSAASKKPEGKIFPSQQEIERVRFAAYGRRASFPLFKGEGGVIESNKIFISEQSPTRAAVEKMLSSSHLSEIMQAAPRRQTLENKEMPPLLADALRKGYVGKRFRQMQVSQTGEPSVIELDGCVYIVKN